MCRQTNMFLLVEFTDNKEIEVIPDNWLDGTSCSVWPSYKSTQKLTKAVTSKEIPGDDWKSFPIRVLYSNEDYLKTRSKLGRAEEESDLQSDKETLITKRKKRPNPRFESSSEDEVPVKKGGPSQFEGGCRSLKQRQEQPQKSPVPPTKRPLDSPSSNSCLTPVETMTPVRPIASAVLKERDIRLFRLLEDIKSEQKAQRILLTNLAAQMGSEKQIDCLCPENITLPLTSVADITNIDDQLKDQVVAKLLVDHLSSIGGSSLKIMTRRLMKRLMTSILAAKFNWTGAKGKNSLESLRISAIILRAVRRNFPQHPHSETELVVKDWLRNAKDRDGGRRNRNSESMPLPDSE